MPKLSRQRPAPDRGTLLRLLGLVVLLAASSTPAWSQSRDRGPLVLELPASAHALALGNSYALSSFSSEALFYQPGLLSRAGGLIASVQRYTPSSTLAAVSAGTSWLSGGVALGIQVLSYGASATEPIEGDDILALPADVGSLSEHGDIAVSETAVSVGYGRTVRGVQVGAVGKFVEQRFGPRQAAVGALDLGASISPGPTVVGLAVQNLGPDMRIGETDIPLPVRLTLGASSRQTPVGPLDLSASAALSYRADGDLVPSLGLEVAYWPVTGRTFVGRVGFRRLPSEQSAQPVTFGGAFLGDNITLEYAYEGFDSGHPAHRLGIGWR